jgi:hypothetical protein
MLPKVLRGLALSVLIYHRYWKLGLEREGTLAEWAPKQLQDVDRLHMPPEPAQQLDGLDRAQEETMGKQQ